ncbi:hypothetical protein ACF0H5_006528 [Mactra antiquata]
MSRSYISKQNLDFISWNDDLDPSQLINCDYTEYYFDGSYSEFESEKCEPSKVTETKTMTRYAMRLLIKISTLLLCIIDVRTECIAPPPCTCNHGNVNCFNLGLTEVPRFTASSESFDSISIDLSRNQIKKLSNNAFFNIATTNATDVEIDLSNNYISEIEEFAFHGIEPDLTSLWLQDNNISRVQLSSGCGALCLQVLNLYNNPIDDFDDILHTVADCMEYLLIGGNVSYPWPSNLQLMTKLKSLQFKGFTEQSIPENAFRSFHSTLTGLTIENSHLTSIPQAVCNLPFLDFFLFHGNTKIKEVRSLVPSCSSQLNSVTSLELSDNHLLEFPDVFKTFPNLTSLKVSGNPNMTYIRESIFANISLTGLDISYNGFTRIPQALNNLTRLPNLFMRHNRIKSLEKDIFPVKDIYLVDFRYNPIIHIADDAFDHDKNMVSLFLDGAAVTSFPKAFRVLDKITSISFWDNHIVCNCSMKWLLSEWPHYDKVAITGSCRNINMTISSYIIYDLPKCP